MALAPSPMMPSPNGAAPAAEMPMAPAEPMVLATIMDNGDGTFTVFAGDEPEGGPAPDMSGDDVAAMGAEGDMPAPEGQQAGSAEEALKLVADILGQAGGGGSPDDQFAAGFAPPQDMPQKY